jgi:hypothetical protein
LSWRKGAVEGAVAAAVVEAEEEAAGEVEEVQVHGIKADHLLFGVGRATQHRIIKPQAIQQLILGLAIGYWEEWLRWLEGVDTSDTNKIKRNEWRGKKR